VTKSVIFLFLILAGGIYFLGSHSLAIFGADTTAAEKDENKVTATPESVTERPVKDNPPQIPAGSVIQEPLPGDSGADGITGRHDDLAQQLSFLQSPIPGATVSTRDSHLPGAPRPYRNGIHEGLDYYSGFCGVPVNFGDPVYAAGEGVIERIDHVYSEPAVAQRDEMLRQSIAAGNMAAAVLDKLRGRQVWIAHAYGVVTRYAHLHEVSEQLQVGDRVEAATFIGTVGNSGTSNGAEGSQDGAHLHFEIRLGDGYLGEGMDPEAVRLLLQKILEDN